MIKRKIDSKIADFFKNHNNENVAAQELSAHGFSLAYFNSKKQGELDFVITYKDKILPIEIKSGKNYERHSALDNILKDSNYNIESAIVFSSDNLVVKGSVTYLPVYMLMFLQNSTWEGEPIYKLNLDEIH